jgi:GLPGLI family protein
MRHSFILSAALVSNLASFAQTDQNTYMQQVMAGHGVKVEDDNDPYKPNAFTGSFRMEMHHYENGAEAKNSPTNMRYWSSEDMTLIQTMMPEGKGRDMKILTDLKGKWMYMLMDDAKGSKTAMKSKKKKVVMNASPEGEKRPEVTVTNETKTIDGHLCTKVISKSSEGTWTGWVAKDLKAPFGDMSRNVRGGDPAMMRGMDHIDGFPLEFEYVDAKGKKVVCYMKEVTTTVDPSVFALDGYNVMEMPGYGQ